MFDVGRLNNANPKFDSESEKDEGIVAAALRIVAVKHRTLNVQRRSSPDFSPSFVAKPPRWFWMRGLRPKTPQAYPLRYDEEADGA